jgi:ATP-dependent Clp endopeptidase proteolytic subunit ClpP
MTKFNNQLQQSSDEDSTEDINPLLSLFNEDIPRIAGLYGEVNEENCKDLIGNLFALGNIKKTITNDDGEEAEITEPIEMIVSTEGGHVTEMFATFDVMEQVKKTCEIHTMGLGKVMSAGILLLAAGTKGKRKVGKHCRLMIHSISGGDFGSIKQLENNIKEVKWFQTQYTNALVANSNMSARQLKAIFRRKSDTYFDANQALKWGIVDEII